ncbi:MAG: hypothetical protein IJD91_08690 [Clostridia bacterium]|nr:hypothetical protein [Clostridia bacterium]
MSEFANQSGVEKSVVYNFFLEEKLAKVTEGHIEFLNDNYFAKRLSENVVEAKLIDLKGVDYKSLGNTVDKICISEFCDGEKVQFAEGQVCGRDALSSQEGHIITEKAIRMARSTLVKAHTNKIDGYYVLLVHPDIADRLIKEKHFSCMQDASAEDAFNMALVGKINDVLIVEIDMLPINKNAKGENIYSSFIFGDYAFGIKFIESQSVLGFGRINERHMVRIETVA